MSNWGLSALSSVATASSSVVVTHDSGSATVPGAWYELTSALPAGGPWFLTLHVIGTSQARNYKVDIGVGASSSEVLVVDGFPVSIIAQTNTADSIRLPVAFAGGQRVALRLQSDAASSADMRFLAQWSRLSALAPYGCSQIIGYNWSGGGNVAGNAITSGVSEAFGTSLEVVASTPRRARFIAIASLGQTNSTDFTGVIRVTYGATDNLAAPYQAVGQVSGFTRSRCVLPTFAACDIPAGSTLHVSAAKNTTTARTLGPIILLGF